MQDVQEWDLGKIESFILKKQADVVIIDQADKVQIDGQYNAGHERLRALYNRLRELAKKCECAIIGVSQASADADGKSRLTYTMMEGSKIGKAAEADLIIGIGRLDAGDVENSEPDNTRYITVSKNKLSGWHGTVICNIEPQISRYVV
jgi:replicative DNA helicase